MDVQRACIPCIIRFPYSFEECLAFNHLSVSIDQDLQQVDLRGRNSWRLLLAEVPSVELLEVHLVNAIAPFVINARLKPLLLATPERDKHVVNVSAVEGQFYRTFKTTRHPHTNMAKAALNMLTRTSAQDYLRSGIHMNSVDTGWVTDEDPAEIAPPQKSAHEYRVYPALIERCNELEPVTTAVAHPCDESSLTAAVEAAEADLIQPILVGPEARIRAVAEQCGLDIRPYRLVDAPHSHASAAKAVEIVRTGEAEALMKGSLHTDELMSAVVSSATGLRTGRRISHAFVMSVPTYPKPLIITDAAINIAPGLEEKRDICQNAIDLAHSLGRAMPKVAILSAVETVTTKIPSTIEAAALCKMAERGQITGAILDGPLAMDNAISLEAAKTKGITSPVAGDADILVAPDLEAGNILAKQLTFLASAGVGAEAVIAAGALGVLGDDGEIVAEGAAGGHGVGGEIALDTVEEERRRLLAENDVQRSDDGECDEKGDAVSPVVG